MKSNKKEYHLQAKRKAYQEVNHSADTGSTVKTAETAQAQPEKSAKKVVAVKKGQNPAVSEVETVSAETTEPTAIGTTAS